MVQLVLADKICKWAQRRHLTSSTTWFKRLADEKRRNRRISIPSAT